jgi:hypothetical protein
MRSLSDSHKKATFLKKPLFILLHPSPADAGEGRDRGKIVIALDFPIRGVFTLRFPTPNRIRTTAWTGIRTGEPAGPGHASRPCFRTKPDRSLKTRIPVIAE